MRVLQGRRPDKKLAGGDNHRYPGKKASRPEGPVEKITSEVVALPAALRDASLVVTVPVVITTG
jgi:hypothetical protein